MIAGAATWLVVFWIYAFLLHLRIEYVVLAKIYSWIALWKLSPFNWCLSMHLEFPVTPKLLWHHKSAIEVLDECSCLGFCYIAFILSLSESLTEITMEPSMNAHRITRPHSDVFINAYTYVIITEWHWFHSFETYTGPCSNRI